MNITDFDYLETKSPKVVVIAGENGSGKSRYLRSIATHYATGWLYSRRPVTIVCNTIYDRFTGLKNVSRISVSQGRNIATKALKKALIDVAYGRNTPSMRAISNILKYCGYSGSVGLELVGLSQEALKEFIENPSNDDYPSKRGLYRLYRHSSNVSDYIHSSDVSDSIEWFHPSVDDRRESYDEELICLIVSLEKTLKQKKVIKSLKFYFIKNDNVVPLTEGSSGELTLISTLLYLYTTASRRGIILIDEPENSLHPLWQKEYITQLIDILYHLQPTIVIATHSPIIVSAGKVRDEEKILVDVEVYKLSNNVLTEFEGSESSTSSVEETYWNVFNTVTPVNHFVSETLATALDDLNAGKMSLNGVKKLIHNMDNASYDPVQKKFFEAAEKLAIKVSKDVNQDDHKDE